MGLTGGPAIIKYLLFFFNLIFVITGIVVLCVGGYIKADYNSYEYFLDDRFFAVPSLLIAVGVIIVIVSFFGCCGSVKEHHCMIITFSVMLLFIFVLELSAGIAGYALKDRAQGFLSDRLKETLNEYNITANKEITKAWDLMQGDLRCCGVEGPNDWVIYHNSSGSLPVTCCHQDFGVWRSQECEVNSTNLYHDGCLEKLGQFIIDHAATIGGSGIGIAFVQILGVGFACCLARAIRRQYESV